MGRKTYTIEDLKQYASKKDGKCLSIYYYTTSTLYEWKCLICGHVWKKTWGSILYTNSWCKICASLKRRKYTIEDLQQYAENHDGKLISTEYTIASKQYTFECKKGHQWTVSWASMHKHLRWCNICKIHHRTPVKLVHYNPLIKTSINACKIVSCQPTRQLWLHTFIENKKLYRSVDYKSIYDGIVKLELIMYKKRLFSAPRVILSAVLYLKSPFSQDKSAKLMHTTTVTIRNLIKALKLEKKQTQQKKYYKPKVVNIINPTDPINIYNEMENIFNQLKIVEYRSRAIYPKRTKFKLWDSKIDDYILQVLTKYGKLRRKEIYTKLVNINKYAIDSRLKLLRNHKYVLTDETHHGLVFYINEDMI